MGIFGNNEDDKDEQPIEQEPEEDNEEDTYEYEIKCDNCEEHETYDIPVGESIKSYFQDEKCDNCGCKLMEDE